MMRRILLIAILLFCCSVALQADAEMKIAPGGATSNGDASVRLNGNFTTWSGADGPSGAVISGENSFFGSDRSYGGYFTSAGGHAPGVYGAATGHDGRGVQGMASGVNGIGVYGKASETGAYNYGGYFISAGYDGKGVYTAASGDGGTGLFAKSTGGYGRGVWAVVDGQAARAVQGIATYEGDNTNPLLASYGGYFTASGEGVYAVTSGNSGHGVCGVANLDADDGIGVYGIGNGSKSVGVRGEGMYCDFYAGRTGNYYPFTGAHEVKFSEEMPEDGVEGLIVSVTGKAAVRKDPNGKISLSSTLPTVTLSSTANDRAVFGVVVTAEPLPKDHWYGAKEGERFGGVNALGEGRVWVTDINGRIRAGDYVTTSEISGYGQMQNDDLLHSYTLGKAIETVDWEQITDTVQHEGRSYKRCLIAVVYTSG